MSEVVLPKVIEDEYEFKSLRFSSYSSGLVYEDVKISTELGEYDVLVNNKAFSVNPGDIIINQFAYSFVGPKRKGFGSDYAGVVVKAGSKSKFKAGDKVYGFIFNLWLPVATSSEYFVFNEKTVPEANKIPTGMSFTQAAALIVASCTAYQSLREHSDLKGKNVLILGAGTSVGTYSVQLAKHFFKADKVVATCSQSSSERVKSYGADATIDYTKGHEYKYLELLKFVKENGKFDIIIDSVRDDAVSGSSGELIKGNDEGGVLAIINGSTTNDYHKIRFVDALPTWGMTKSWFKSMWSNGNPKFKIIIFRGNEGYSEAVEKLWDEKKLKIPIDSEFDAMSQYEDAINRVSSFKARGKVVCNF